MCKHYLVHQQPSIQAHFNPDVSNTDLLVHEMQDIEFTVQENRLWMLQCRSGKRTGQGAVKIAVDLVNEGVVDRNAAIKMVEPGHLDQLLHPQVIHNYECM